MCSELVKYQVVNFLPIFSGPHKLEDWNDNNGAVIAAGDQKRPIVTDTEARNGFSVCGK